MAAVFNALHLYDTSNTHSAHIYLGVGFLIAIGKWFLLLDFIMMQCALSAHRYGLSDTYGFERRVYMRL